MTHASKRRSAALQLKLARSLSAAAVLAVRGAVATTQAWAQESRGSANDLIIRTVALTAADSARLTRGETVVRVLRTGYDRDVAIVGAVQVAAPRSFFMDRQRDFARALRTPVVSISLRLWPPDFPDDIAVQRRAPYEARADAIMYRRLLAELADARGWEVHCYDAKNVEAQAATLLGERADEVLLGPRATLGPPWTKDHRAALAATVLACHDHRRACEPSPVGGREPRP